MRFIQKLILFFIFLLVSILIIFSFVYFDACYIEPNWIQINKVVIVDKDLAEVFDGYKVVQISDLDIDEIGYREEKLVNLINYLNPDFLFFTGDLIDSWLYFDQVMELFKKMNIKGKIFAVTGDNDYSNIQDMDLLQEKFKEAGVIFLRSRSLKLAGKDGKYFWLVFLDRKKDFEQAVKDIDKKYPSIFLAHYPENIYKVADFGGDLLLAGNTQGGQVGISWIRNLSDYASSKLGEFVSGLYKVNNSYLYVNRGIGVSGRNIRFFCRPEITVFKFTDKGRGTKINEPENKDKNRSLLYRLVRVIFRKMKFKQGLRHFYDSMIKFVS